MLVEQMIPLLALLTDIVVGVLHTILDLVDWELLAFLIGGQVVVGSADHATSRAEKSFTLF